MTSGATLNKPTVTGKWTWSLCRPPLFLLCNHLGTCLLSLLITLLGFPSVFMLFMVLGNHGYEVQCGKWPRSPALHALREDLSHLRNKCQQHGGSRCFQRCGLGILLCRAHWGLCPSRKVWFCFPRTSDRLLTYELAQNSSQSQQRTCLHHLQRCLPCKHHL